MSSKFNLLHYMFKLMYFIIFLGWSYDDILHYFKKSEDNEDEEVYKHNSKFHGKGGYLTVEWFPYVDPTAVALIKVQKS